MEKPMPAFEVEHIKKSIRPHLEDLHLMMTHEQISIDTEYYNEITMALLVAEDGIKRATRRHNERIKAHTLKYGPPNTMVD